MAHIVDALDAPSSYRDSRAKENRHEQQLALSETSTLYIGNLSFYTTEEQMYELFSRVGDASTGGGIKRVIMGLDRNTKTPCGFAFVEYYTHAEAVDCMRYISGTKLDERVIRCDLDSGYREGRQYGRGKSGGQVRDEYRQEYDAGRGGWGHNRLREEAERQERERRLAREAVYAEAPGDGPRDIPAGAEGAYAEREGAERAGEGVVEKRVAEDHGAKRARGQSEDAVESNKNPRFRDDRSDSDDD